MSEQPEEWRVIPSFPDYEASSLGRIRRRTTKSNRKAGLEIRPYTKTWHGYALAQLRKNGKHYPARWHRLIAETFIPNPEGKPHVNHIDGDKLNNPATNLEWVTRKENDDHAKSNGLTCSGEERSLITGTRKLSKESVLEIRALSLAGVTNRAIARRFNMNDGWISRIVTRKAWAWL